MKLTLEHVNFGYPNFKIQDINLEFSSGEIVAITGNNGGGKTTMLGIISGLNKAKKGSVLIDGEPIKKSKAVVGIIFQNPDSQIIFNNVYDDLCFTLKNFAVPKNEWDARIDEALGEVGMLDHKHSEIFTMSAGQKQRIVIANMLAVHPDILIFDESSSYLDTAFKNKFYELLIRLKKQGKMVIFATNVLEEIAFADRVVFVSKGKIVFNKPKNEVIDNLQWFEENEIYVPLKLKLMKKLGIYTGSDDDIFNAVGNKKWFRFLFCFW